MKLKFLEFVQSAYNGGFPVPNGEGFEHGDTILVFSKRELLSLLYKTRRALKSNILDMVTEEEAALFEAINDILKEDKFICRDDLE